MFLMWGTATTVFVVAGIATLIGTEVVRSIVDRYRKQTRGIGGTQDIAIWGMLIGYVCVAGAVVCGGVWLWNR
jgi:hypothetical protein